MMPINRRFTHGRFHSKFRILLLAMLALLTALTGCTMREFVPTSYYVLQYYSHGEQTDLRRDEPYDYTLQVMPATISRTYNRKQLVLRHYGPKITYAESDLWSVKPGDAIPMLVSKRLARNNLFRQVRAEYLNQPPDLELHTHIQQIELLIAEDAARAHLEMEFFLNRRDDNQLLVQYNLEREVAVPPGDLEAFVMRINEMILEESDQLTRLIEEYFETGKTVTVSAGLAGQQDNNTLEKSPFISTTGFGLLTLPAISGADNEPFYYVMDENDQPIDKARMGHALQLPVGRYTVMYGSGTSGQLMQQTGVEVISHYKTIVEPLWGSLTIRMVDENQNFIRVPYELFDDAGNSYGTDIPAEVEIGEQRKVWILEPGLYKLTINNEPFLARRDFATVQVKKGEAQELTIVVSTDENDNPTHLVGAGVLVEQKLRSRREHLKYSSSIHGNMSIQSSNESDRNKQRSTLSVDSRLDNHVVYDRRPFYYSLRHRFELETTKAPDTDFRLAADDFDLKNTLILYFLKDLGFYGRFDLNTHLFPQYDYSNTSCLRVDSVGDTLSRASGLDRVEVKPNFYPMIMKEGLGLNYRVLRNPRANLSLRAGLGWRQELNEGYYVSSGQFLTINGVDYMVFHEQPTNRQDGIEFSLVGRFRLPWNIVYTTDADYLLPFNTDQSIALLWENNFNLRLFRYISFEYEYTILNQTVSDADDYLIHDHSAYLRLTYILR